MNVYLDDNLADPVLQNMLVKGGHRVVRPSDLNLSGESDCRHLECAIREGLAVLTSDSGDFRDLHQLIQTAEGTHTGILIVRYENNLKRDMKPKHIAAAVAKLEASGTSLTNQVVMLNSWR